jgi:predicted RNA-binding protein with PUA-like domain
MNFWLFKSEPKIWSWDDQIKKNPFGEPWDGVRNFQASNNMKLMKLDDLGFFYHSGSERQIVGIVKVIKEYYPDHTDKTKRFGMVDIIAVKPTIKIVTLKQIKKNNSSNDIVLVKQPRLSLTSIPRDKWEIILKMSFTQI